MKKIVLYHGSTKIISKPSLKKGKVHNDYGQGFYMTLDKELAKEWASQKNKPCYINKYELDLNNLKILNLMDKKYDSLNWLAILLNNRLFDKESDIEREISDFLLKNYLIDLSNYDLVIGYRADDSYFRYAQMFISNNLSLRILEKALLLGNLGIQYALISEKAFKNLNFISYENVEYSLYYKKYIYRDNNARNDFIKLSKDQNYKEDIFALDFLRGKN